MDIRSHRTYELCWRFRNQHFILYLRRLQKDECLETYDMAYAGRNRRYYKITDKGTAQLNLYREEWKIYSSKISTLFEGGIKL